ncbi:uncharacterized protein BDR25DRAFT_355452 [Lindgomyces ingoldianus]|uniref:Uncharacterized protein n=1 Tax=Lindgomyces ingoldianus TaxID=673940 RepID=A0ACB6QTN0_9PLEO|nr:uncharacterized protein BDR25DRAFT_355452 [Lindgomyces ingoldianus]KAF2470338.1 hypothetical protein BDR25DRAFT_355452 [Lindgomyces ingoldianus]
MFKTSLRVGRLSRQHLEEFRRNANQLESYCGCDGERVQAKVGEHIRDTFIHLQSSVMVLNELRRIEEQKMQREKFLSTSLSESSSGPLTSLSHLLHYPCLIFYQNLLYPAASLEKLKKTMIAFPMNPYSTLEETLLGGSFAPSPEPVFLTVSSGAILRLFSNCTE